MRRCSELKTGRMASAFVAASLLMRSALKRCQRPNMMPHVRQRLKKLKGQINRLRSRVLVQTTTIVRRLVRGSDRRSIHCERGVYCCSSLHNERGALMDQENALA